VNIENELSEKNNFYEIALFAKLETEKYFAPSHYR